jgi:hypothetical protein
MNSSAYGNRYCHTQCGRLIIVVLLGLMAVFSIGGTGRQKAFWLAVPVLLITAWLFSSLTIEISEDKLRWRFGPGLIRKSVPLEDIVSAKPIRTNLLDGWGIHMSRYGWLYNVSGFDAVAITLRSGKRFALGTDEPLLLSARLAESIRRSSCSL